MTPKPFSKVLIANRGEIACRVIEAARAKGYQTVAVYSDADAGARHIELADFSFPIGPPSPAASYLSVDRILQAARETGADAIHPGYGFLSENAEFAAACEQAGLTFIGPTPHAIEAMGNKAAAKRRMIEANVPCVPGYQAADQDNAGFVSAAADIGYPVMVKAAAGGGGRGMRLVGTQGALTAALDDARREAKSAFGSGELILEKALLGARHVEIQVVGDMFGNVIHAGERDCSVQRRHQKVLEEAPCPVLSTEGREAMGMAAVRAAKAIDYRGAGTVEFLLDADGSFYFLEMNTRIQVEHPVTEMVTGLDLVGLQLDVAAGLELPITQQDVHLDGHAIEARLYAEGPADGFLPQTGTIVKWAPPRGEGIRVDHGLVEGYEVSPFYDSMLAKIIAWGKTRDEARRRLIRALHDTSLFGVQTNKTFLIDMLSDAVFAAGGATTAFIAERFPAPAAPDQQTTARSLSIAAALYAQPAGMHAEGANWWSTGEAVSLLRLAINGIDTRLTVRANGDTYRVSDESGGATLSVTLSHVGDQTYASIDGQPRLPIFASRKDAQLYLQIGAHTFLIDDLTFVAAQAAEAGSDGILRAPMNGVVSAVQAEAGASAKKGDILVVLEAMKIAHRVTAPFDCTVESVAVAVNDQVATRAVLITLRPAS